MGWEGSEINGATRRLRRWHELMMKRQERKPHLHTWFEYEFPWKNLLRNPQRPAAAQERWWLDRMLLR